MERDASVDNFVSVGFGLVFTEISRLYRGGLPSAIELHQPEKRL